MKRPLSFLRLTFTLLTIAILHTANVSAKIYCGKIVLNVGDTYEVSAVPTSGYTASGSFSKTGTSFAITANGSYYCKIKANYAGTGTLSYWGVVSGAGWWTTETWDMYWDIEVKAATVKVTSISLSSSSASLKVGETKQLSATVSPSNATDKSVSWTTSSSSVATVSSSGLVTAKGNGSATITCKANDGSGKYATCSVTVSAADPVKVTGISLNYTSLSLVKEDTRYLRATVTPSNATDKTVTWTTSNNSVATVSSDGVVTAVNRGTATITCKANDGSGVQATCDVTVSSVKNWTQFTAKTVEGIEMKFYSKSDGTCYVYGTSSLPAIDVSTTGPVTIPSEAEGLKVTSISGYSFYNCTGITKVTVPNTVESIGYSAFEGCSSLETAALGNGLKELNTYAFKNCTSLNSITGISQLELIGGNAFYNTPWYNNLPDGLIYLGKVLYMYKGTMPDNTTIRVNDGVKMISQSAFSSCKGLVGISIPQSVETIGSSLFYGCINLKSIIVASGNAKFDSRNNCNAIIDKEKNILIAGCTGSTIPSTVTAIGYGAFYGSGIEEIIIPNNVDSIATNAFLSCSSLKTVGIGKGTRVIEALSFQLCSALRSITVVSNNPYYDSRNNCNAIIEKSTDKLVVGCTTTVIPQSVKAIGRYAFYTSDYDTYSITIPDMVETIGECAFGYLDHLHTITIGKGIKKIDKNAFYGCNALRSIHAMSREPVEIDETVFKSNYTYFPDSIYNNAVLYVPTGARINYMTTPCWNKFKHIVETDGQSPCDGDVFEPDGSPLVFAVTSVSGKTCEVIGAKSSVTGRISIPTQAEGCSVNGIGSRAFYYKEGITHIDIPTSVTYLDDYALYYCSDIESVELPSSLQRIGYFALGGLAKVTRIIIPKSVTDIDRGIFTADSMMTSVTVEAGNPIYDSRGGCNAVMETATNRLVAGIYTSVIPQETKTIGYFAFNSQKKLKSVKIPHGITCIDEYAFNNCGLKRVTIPASVDSIGQWAFRYCGELREVVSLIENPTAINENVFHTDNINSKLQFTSATLYVPIGCKGKYQMTEGWNKFRNIVEGEPAIEPDPQPTLKGDVNEDEKVNGTDLVALTNIILGKSPEKASADVNGDTKVNGTDYVALANIILGKTASRRATRAAGAKGLSIEEFSIKAGETKEMVIDLTNPEDEITLVQFDLRLPAGLSLKQTGGEYDFDIAGRTTWRKHSLDANAQADGSIRFLLASSSNAVLSGTEGAIITMTLVADNSFAGGDIKLENILMVTPDEKEKTQDTYVYSVGSPQPQPEPSSADLAIEPFAISAGETKEMVIDLMNPEDEITLVQFDLRLPAGLSLKQTGGEYDFDIAGRTTWRKHSLDANAQADGTIRFLLASSSNTVLDGKEGAVIKMTLIADNSYSNDVIRLENILLVTPDEKEIMPANVEYLPTGITDVVLDSSKPAPVYTLSGQRLVAPKKGVNIIGGKKVIVK